MNNRYKELWDQAAKLESDSSWAGQIRFMEKYTELIVRECAELATKHYNGYDPIHGEDILEHFGVDG